MQSWLEVFGRLHVLVLHLPIGMLVALAALEVLALRRDLSRERVALAGLTALAAIVTAATGWVHGHTEGRLATDTLQLHQWLGLTVALLCAIGFLLARRAADRPAPYRATLVISLVLLVPTGDLGAEMTHGPGFLLEPLRPQPVQAPQAEVAAPTYAHVIAPLIAGRCGACHNSERHKGQLVLVSPEGLRMGGRNGPVFEAGKPRESEMLRRVRLPLDDEDHMPPPEKPQPTTAEIALLEAWIAAGAPFDGTFALASPVAEPAPAPQPTPSVPVTAPPADPVSLAALEAAQWQVAPAGENLLRIDASAVATTIDDAQAQALLAPLCEQVADLSLAHANVGDGLMPIMALCPRLRRLDLRETRLTNAGLKLLAGHRALEELVLIGTHLDDHAVDTLITLPKLQSVHVWGAGLTDGALLRLGLSRPNLVIRAAAPADAAKPSGPDDTPR